MKSEEKPLALQHKKFAVLGDIALDLAYFSSVGKERSVETGLEVRSVHTYSFDAGGAGNLALDIASLGARCDLYGICGDDVWADMLEQKLTALDIDIDGCIREQNFTTAVYHKMYDENSEELPRFDIGHDNVYRKKSIDKMLAKLQEKLAEYDGLLINQQFPNSIHTRYMQRRLFEILQAIQVPVWVDARKDLQYPNCSYKMNAMEAIARTGMASQEDCLKALYSRLVMTNNIVQSIVITQGQDGAIAFNGEESIRILGISSTKKTDPVGAGDAFLAALATAQASGYSLHKSMKFANLNAATSARILHATGHPKMEEVLDLAKSPDYRYNPALASDLRLATYLPGTEIEIIGKEFQSLGYPKVAIFDHDGTISTIRQGWETVMRTLMVEAIAGKAISRLTAENLKAIHNAVEQMIEKTTGIQTIVQMAQLVELIHEFGYVPAKEIKTPLAYKDEYAKRLSRLLQVKYDRYRDGIYDVADLTMKGALPFLSLLREHDTRIFLASGSDYADVRFETETFGYAHCFNGGIFGSESDITNDPKKLVMANIMQEIQVVPNEVVVFGDGPVEIREGKKRGFLTIGIVSDERQRFGLNLKKRERLVLAGADILIPDYSWTEKLAKYLRWEQ